jgi:hypothetical protein
MDNGKNSVSRKKFLFWGLGVSSLLALPAFLRSSKKTKPLKTVKMLTQDGRLVEVDATALSGKKTKIKDKEIFTWVNKKPRTL